MALASQVAANQPPLLSSPAHRRPRTSTNALLLLQQPAAAVLGGRNLRLARRDLLDAVVARASSEAKATAAETTKASGGSGVGGEEEDKRPSEYEVTIQKPYGIKFTKGRDGGTYIEAIAPGGAADLTGEFEVGDKVLATSAVFGEEIWPTKGYGQAMYSIRQRVGPLYLKMERRFGKVEGDAELTEKEIIRFERNSGVVSGRVREIQLQNYQRKMAQKMQREEDLRMGLMLYKSGKYEEALEKFETVLGSKPEPSEASIASYNIACSYSKLGRIEAGLSALEEALKAGYEDFKRVRSDPDLANLRKSEEFERLLKNYDESFINENAINAIKSLFGMGKQ